MAIKKAGKPAFLLWRRVTRAGLSLNARAACRAVNAHPAPRDTLQQIKPYLPLVSAGGLALLSVEEDVSPEAAAFFMAFLW